jgi:hypothetical protein
MASWKFRCTLTVFLLAAILAAPLTSSAEPRVRTERGPGAVWNLLADLWSHIKVAWEANGCSIDPFGGCVPSASRPELDRPLRRLRERQLGGQQGGKRRRRLPPCRLSSGLHLRVS